VQLEEESRRILYASEDAGVTWRFLSTIADVPDISLAEPALLQTATGRVIRDDLANWDATYPSTTVMPDGRVFTVYYFNMFHRFFMVGSFFTWER
jgi:hypothetical protein